MARKIKQIIINSDTVIADRAKRKENQSTFWPRLGVNQSTGSRYETAKTRGGRNVPKPLRMLIALETGKATIEQLRNGDLSQMV